MEIYRGTAGTATFVPPTGTTSIDGAVWYYRGDEPTGLTPETNPPTTMVVDPWTPGDAVATGALPYVQYDGEIIVKWTFQIGSTTYDEYQYYQVVTPILTTSEIQSIITGTDYYADGEFTSQEIIDLEVATRKVIEAHTHQTFGKSVGTWRVRGRGERYLRLPARLVYFTEVVGTNVSSLYVGGDGWYLLSIPPNGVIPRIRADYEEINSNTHLDIPIRAPYISGMNVFPSGQTIAISGVWGYHYVPTAVKEAAKLILNDIATDGIYRDRYLTSMTAADWRIQFNPQAFTGTGNARADKLLAEYVVPIGMAVI